MKLAPHRRLALEAIAFIEWAPSGRADWTATDWLIENALITEVRSLVCRWTITDQGRAALRTPYTTMAGAEAACKRWRDRGGNQIGTIMGWAFVPCRGGGFAVRVGFQGKPNVLLPEGIDPELIRRRKWR